MTIPRPGAHQRCRALRRHAAPALALALAVACARGAGGVAAAADTTLRVLSFRTYDGSGQVMHPDVALVPTSWSGRPYRLVLTPYPSSNAQRENPSLYSSYDGVSWRVPIGVRNPIASTDRGHLSDPALVMLDVERELRLYYRQVNDSTRILLQRSTDGKHWSPPELLLAAGENELLSPSVVREGAWQMWSVNGGTGCYGTGTSVERRTSTDGRHWSAPRTVALRVPVPGLYPWHIAVAWIAAEQRYWALLNVKRAGDCDTPAMFLAVSTDGLVWHTLRKPIITRGAIPQFQHMVYRGALLYDARNDAVRFWFSGARKFGDDYNWHIASQRRPRAWIASLDTEPDSTGIESDAPPVVGAGN